MYQLKYFDLICANADLESFNLLISQENKKSRKKSIFAIFSIYIYTKNFFWSRKIRKIRFFKKCSILLLNDHMMSETCLGTSRDPYSCILTCCDGLLPWCENLKFLKNRIFLENLDFFNFCYFMGGWLARWGKIDFCAQNTSTGPLDTSR